MYSSFTEGIKQLQYELYYSLGSLNDDETDRLSRNVGNEYPPLAV
jgi:hypothetical protein